jgi:hypothetical protein
MNMEPRKQAIIDALTRFVDQRSGIEFADYGDVKAFRAEQRSITKDLHHARTLLSAVEWRDGITADDLIKAAHGAYSGRLTITEPAPAHLQAPGCVNDAVSVDYCTGQYFPTEYRRAVCAVLASALWDYTREKAMPAPNSWRVKLYATDVNEYATGHLQIHAACEARQAHGGESKAYLQEFHNKQTPGDWLRAHFRKEFGRGIASRWFS